MKEKGEHLVASKLRWDDCPREETAWKDRQEREEEDRRKWFAAYEDAETKRMLKYLEDSEDLRVSLRELKEQLESPEEAGISFMQIAQQARNERGKKVLPDLRARRE